MHVYKMTGKDIIPLYDIPQQVINDHIKGIHRTRRIPSNVAIFMIHVTKNNRRVCYLYQLYGKRIYMVPTYTFNNGNTNGFTTRSVETKDKIIKKIMEEVRKTGPKYHIGGLELNL